MAMALSQCAEDVLLSIASYIHYDPQPASYEIDFEERRRIFRPLVLVCRRWNAIYTPLLYRTLCLKHEKNTWPAKYEQEWLQQNRDRRVMDALCRTLQLAPALCLCIYYLEVTWERHDDTSEDHESINTYISMFPHLRGLHISGPQQLYLDSREWKLNIPCSSTQIEALTELRITQTVAARMLPTIFFLPNIDTLEVTVLDAKDIDSWSIPPKAQPRHSGVVHFFLTAGLTSEQLLLLLSWPAALKTFVYNHKSYSPACPQAPTTSTFSAALQPFCRSLSTLKFEITNPYATSVDALEADLQKGPQDNHTSCLDFSSFYSLKDLQMPSHFLVGLPGEVYRPGRILNLLPSSLQSLEVNFGPQGSFLSRRWQCHSSASDRFAKYVWLFALNRFCRESGRFPYLKSVFVSDTGPTEAWRPASGLQKSFAEIGVHMHVAISSPRIFRDGGEDDDEEFQMYEDRYEDRRDDWDNGAPIFGQELTEHSSSPRGSEVGSLEKEHEEKMLRMDEWEGFDATMASERERLAESWVKGQWPDYEDSREERDEMFRWGGQERV
ncbi:hypothetical protein MMC17_000091 [Xylographa soralifera]|nr:hypothetical protein [Xylographa soralifera]